MPVQDNYLRQKSPNSPTLRHKLGSRSPTRDVDMRNASHGLLTREVSPVRTASNEYIG